MKSKTISIKVEATQFEKGDTSFAGGQVRNLKKPNKETGKVEAHKPGIDEEPFAIVDGQRVEQGMWLVKLPSGTEVWSDEQVKNAGKDVTTDARLQDEDIKKEAADKTVANYKEHNPKPGDDAPQTSKAESKDSKSVTGKDGK